MIWTWSTVINVTVCATPAEAFVRCTIFGCADSKMNDESLELVGNKAMMNGAEEKVKINTATRNAAVERQRLSVL